MLAALKRLLPLLLFASSCFAQTTVNLSVTDTPDNQTWNNGTWTVALVNAGNPGQSSVFTLLSGGGSIANQSGSLSGTGTASMSLPANINIGPAGTKWQFTVCPQVSAGCFISNVTVGTSSPQTAALTPPSIRINLSTATPPISAYIDGEISGAVLGSSYYNLSVASVRVCAVVTGNSCTSWNNAGGSIPTVTSNPATCTVGQTFFNTTTGQFLLCTGTNVLTTAAGYPATVTDPMLFGAKPDLQWVTDGTWSTGSGNFSSPSLALVAADNGKACTGLVAGAATLPVGTLTVTTATSGSCSVVATGNAVGTGIFIYGTDNTTILQTAWTAMVAKAGKSGPGNCGGTFIIPSGGLMWTTANPVTTVPPTGSTVCGQFDTMLPMWVIRGYGPGISGFFMAPTFTLTNTAGGCLFTGVNSCFFGWPYSWHEGYSVYGFGFKFAPASPIVLYNAGGANIHATNIILNGIITSAQAITAFSLGGQENSCIRCFADNAGSAGNGFNIGGVGDIYTAACYTNTGVTAAVPWNDYGSVFDSHVTTTGDSVTISGTFINPINLYGTRIQNVPIAGFAGLSVNSSTSTVNLIGAKLINNGNTANVGLLFRGNNGTINLSGGTQIIAGATGNGAVWANSTTGDTVNFTPDTVFTGVLDGTVNYVNMGGDTVVGRCTGTVTASSTLGLYGTGSNETLSTCTSTTIGNGVTMRKAGTLRVLSVSAGTGGVNASSGVFTVLKNGSAQTMTCTVGTGTSCIDQTHTVAFVKGDLISISFTTQAADTLANIQATIVAAN